MTSSDTPRVQHGVEPLDWARAVGEVETVRRELEIKLKARRRQNARRTKVAAGALAVAGLLAWLVPVYRSTSTVATPAAQRQTLALVDGSRAELNARTEMKTDFRYGRRVVRLEKGEAFFSVAKDPGHPFVVETPRGIVRVTGTRFNVRIGEDGNAWVTLVEGSVQVASSRNEESAVDLVPSQQLELSDAQPPPRTLGEDQLANVLAWRTGRIVFDGLTLAEAARHFSDYHGVKIAVATDIAKIPVGGKAQIDDLEGFLQFLERAFPVHVLPQEGSYRVFSAPEKNP